MANVENYIRFLTDEESTELERAKRKKRRMELKAIGAFRKWHLERITVDYSLEENLDLSENDNSKDELRIVVIGKTGVGKSATANTILGKELFQEDISAETVTKRSSFGCKKINGRRVHVIDTPGLEDFAYSNEEVLQRLSKVLFTFSKGVHAFVFVFNLASPRFSKEDKETLKALETRFGGKIKNHSILVYTHAECLPDYMDLEIFCTRQKESNTPVGEFLEELGSKIVAVNNNSSIPAERQRNQHAILNLIDKMKKENNNKPYTSKMFEEADKLQEIFHGILSDKGVNPKLGDAVTQILATSPSVKPIVCSIISEVENKLTEELKELKDNAINNATSVVEKEIAKIEQSLQRKRKFEEIEDEHQEVMLDIKSTEGALKTFGIKKQVEEVTTSHENLLLRFQNYLKGMWKSVGL